MLFNHTGRAEPEYNSMEIYTKFFGSSESTRPLKMTTRPPKPRIRADRMDVPNFFLIYLTDNELINFGR
jgi:hypothetical protein